MAIVWRAARCLTERMMTAEVMEMLARCEKLDLCQNVFVGGEWGAYRCCAMPPAHPPAVFVALLYP